MFISDVGPAKFNSKLDVEFAVRFSVMLTRPKRVAYYYHEPDTSTFRYRVQNMVDVINTCANDFSAGWFSETDARRLSMVVDAADVIVLCRCTYNHLIEEIISHARRLGKPILFDVDDLVFDVRYIDLLIETLDEDYNNSTIWDKWFAYVGRLSRTLQLCDRAIVTNARLAELLQDASGKSASIVPNFINEVQTIISDKILAEKRSRKFRREGAVSIGYFSGSPTHARDFEIVTDALKEIMKRDNRVILRTVGHIDPTRWLADFADRIEHHDLQDYVNLQRLIGTTEINLIPLQDNLFTNCKSELKFFEAAITGTVSIASPTFVYTQTINDGVDGLLAHEHMWEECIGEVIASLDTNEYGKMAGRAAVKCNDRYGWRQQLPAISAALFPGDDVPTGPSSRALKGTRRSEAV